MAEDQIYNAASPDELALVNAAKYFGMIFCQRETGIRNTLRLDYKGKSLTYELLNLIEFNSARKRMTSVLKDPEGRIFVQCKGADSIIIPLLSKQEQDSPLMKQTNEHLDEYAKTGLRTLLICEREMTQRDYDEWAAAYEEAACNVVGRDEEMDRVAERLECNFKLVGATAIEDKL